VCRTTRSGLRARLGGRAVPTGLLLFALPPSALAVWGAAQAVGRLTGSPTTGQVPGGLHEYAAQAPVVDEILGGGRLELVALGVLLAVWAGARVLRDLVGTRRVRAVALCLATVGLTVLGLPMVVLGRGLVESGLPSRLGAVGGFYWPVIAVVAFFALTLLFHHVTPRRAPWWRESPGAALVVAAAVVITAVAREMVELVAWTTPLAVLLWLYAVAFSVLVGAELNAATRVLWPPTDRTSPTTSVVEWSSPEPDRRARVDDGVLDRILAAEQRHLELPWASDARDERWREAS
jgi:membrane protein